MIKKYKNKKVPNLEQDVLSRFRGMRVLILGLGLNEGGVGSARFFAKNGAKVLVTDLKKIQDLNPSLNKLQEFADIKYHLGGHKFEDIDWADLTIRNQAIKPNNPFLEYAISKGKEIKTDIEIFLESVNRKNIIGVTGTKGKSTTASLIYEVLKKLYSGSLTNNTILIGNIGVSVLDSIGQIRDNTLVVLEISSFQLESFDTNNISPKYAVITNIYPDHLNYYPSFKNYIQSKRLIFKNQTAGDFLFIKKDDKILNSKEFLKDAKSKIIFYSKNDLPKDFSPKLLGEANKENIAAALTVLKTLEIPKNKVLGVLKQFNGVPFRMELIKNWNGIKIYNNTAATSPEPAIESLKTFPNCILICGGMNKGLEYKNFAKVIEKYAKKVFFLEGDATKVIIKQLSTNSQKKVCGVYDNLILLLKEVKKIIKSGDVILFSPGATSFNLFQNEFDRGRKFNESVEKVFD